MYESITDYDEVKFVDLLKQAQDSMQGHRCNNSYD